MSTRTTLPWLLIALGFALACGRDGFGLAQTEGDAPEAQDMEPDPFFVPDEEDVALSLSTPRLVVRADEGPGPTWDVQLQGLVAVEDGFLAVFHQNIEGRVRLRASLINAMGQIGPIFDVSLDHEALISVDGSSRAFWNGQSLAFFWSAEGLIQMRDFDGSGSPITAPRVIIDTERRLAPIYGMTPTDIGFLMLLEGRGEDMVLHEMDRAGRVFGQRVVTPPAERGRINAIQWTPQRTTLSWAARRAGDTDQVWREILDGQKRVIYESEHATGALSRLPHPDPQGNYMTVFDWDRGWSLYDVNLETEKEVVFIESNHGISPLQTPGGRFGLLGGVGRAFELPGFLRFSAYDADWKPLGELEVRESDEARGCIEFFAFTAGRSVFGLMWQRGCDQERQIYFATVPYAAID